MIAPKVIGATIFTNLRPIDGLFAMRNMLGGAIVVGDFAADQVRDGPDSVGAEDACRCWTVLVNRGVDETRDIL